MCARRSFLLLLLASLFVLPASSFAAEKAKGTNPTKGNAKGFVVTTLGEDPTELDSTVLYGKKPVLLVFWASWCGPCLMEIPTLNKLYDQYGDDIQFIGISIDTQPTPALLKAHVQKTAKARKIAYPFAVDLDGSLAERFKVEAIPMMIAVDLDGNATTKVGLQKEATLEALLRELKG